MRCKQETFHTLLSSTLFLIAQSATVCFTADLKTLLDVNAHEKEVSRYFFSFSITFSLEIIAVDLHNYAESVNGKLLLCCAFCPQYVTISGNCDLFLAA